MATRLLNLLALIALVVSTCAQPAAAYIPEPDGSPRALVPVAEGVAFTTQWVEEVLIARAAQRLEWTAPPWSESSVGDATLFFQARELDPTTGLYDFRYRWYSAELGRFLSRDPLGYPDGPNQYAAFLGNPIRYRDPMGLEVDSELAVVLQRIQNAADEAARLHGVKDFDEVLRAGVKGTAVHETMQRLLVEDQRFAHPRIITEVELDSAGDVTRFGRRSRAAADALVKDVVILRPGVSQATLRGRSAREVTGLVLDLKLGLHGARMREMDTIRRFGVGNIELRPFQNIHVGPAKSLKRLKWLTRLPVLSMFVAGMTYSEAAKAAESGDLERAVLVLTGADFAVDLAKDMAIKTEAEIRAKMDAAGVSGARRNAEVQQVVDEESR